MLLNHPEIPSCADCRTWLYGADWKRATRAGKELRRPPRVPTPCWKCPKSTTGRPSPENELDSGGYRQLEFYYRIKAGMPMPDDALVQWYCGLIRWVEDQVNRSQASMSPFLAALLGNKTGR